MTDVSDVTDVDPRRCPLCGGPNDCGIAAGASTCWCFSTEIPSDVRDRIPPEARDLACVCRACAERKTSQSQSQLVAEEQDV